MSENGRNGYYKAEQFIEAISDSAGIISTIARRVGCSWHTAKKYCTEYATVRQAYEDEREKVIDMAETTVLKAIKGGDVGTARWYLATIGKDRGFTERREVSGPDGGPIETKDTSNYGPAEHARAIAAFVQALGPMGDQADDRGDDAMDAPEFETMAGDPEPGG